MKYIYTHIGLGDLIICNGLVRHFKELYPKIRVFCRYCDVSNIEYMYRDNPDIEVLPLYNDSEVWNYILNNNIQSDVIRTGFELQLISNFKTFDSAFYEILNLPFSYRFEKFYIERDIELENDIYNIINPTNEPYIFIHGDIDRTKIRHDLKIIENPINYRPFNLLKLFENAEELHLMESSLRCLVNSYKYEQPNIFYHQYVRNCSEYTTSLGQNEFITIL